MAVRRSLRRMALLLVVALVLCASLPSGLFVSAQEVSAVGTGGSNGAEDPTAVQDSSSSEESSEASSQASSEESSQASNDDGRVTIIENSNHLNALAEKKTYDEATEAKMHEEKLKRDTEEHQKKMQAFERQQRAEQNLKSEENLKQKTKLVEERNEKQKVREAAEKAKLEAATKRTAEEGQKSVVRARQAATQREQEARAKGTEEGRAKAAAHAKRKEEIKNHHKNAGGASASISLGGGWSNYGHGYAPATFARTSSLCSLEGLINGAGGHMATLPAECRPGGGRLIFTAHRSGEHRVDVLPDGRVYRITGHGSHTWTSLSGITFDTQRPHGLWLGWNWVSYGHGYRPVQQTNSPLCVVSGLIRSGSWNYFGRVNSACFPRANLIFSGNNHATNTRVDVRHDGYIFRAGGTANHHWVSLDNIVYTSSEGTLMNLYNGWQHYHSGYRRASYSRVGNLCVLSGLIRGPWSSHITTLPPGCRPSERLIFGANVHEHDARIDVLPSGAVHFINRHGRHGWVSLSNIRFVARR